MTEFKNVSDSVQVGLNAQGSLEIRQTVPGGKPRSVTIWIHDVPTLIFALNDMLEEGRERAHVFMQNYRTACALIEDSDEQEAPGRT